MSKKNRRSTRNNKVICIQCKLEIQEDEEESIECDKCKKNFHIVCTTLDKRQYLHLLQHETEEFACHLCDNSNNNAVKAELNEIKTELKKLDQLCAINESMNFLSKQFDDILKGVAENKKKLEAVQKENKLLKTEIVNLKNSVKYINEQRVKNDCLVTGLKGNGDMSAVDAVLKLTKDAGVVMTEESISDAYFLKPKNAASNVKSVVVKFGSKKSKDRLMSIKPKLHEKEETKKIYVQDYLSKETMNLLNHAKSLRAVGYRAVYAAGGRVFTKRSELSNPRLIRSVEEVDQLLLEATTHPREKPTKQASVTADDPDNSDTSLS